MAELPQQDELYETTCPHCGREFEGRVLAGGASSQRGFKCPHCKLFIPFERASTSSPGQS